MTVVGSYVFMTSRAATPVATAQPENGTITDPAVTVADAATSGGSAIAFRAPAVSLSGDGFSIPGTELIYQTPASIDADMARAANAGAKWVRFDFAAVQMEAQLGVTNFTNTDKAVASARAHGLRVLGILTTLPAWSASNWTVGPVTAAQRTAYTNWAVRVVQHNAGKVDAWEIWNEPNLDQFWSPAPSVANYAMLIKQAQPAIKPYVGSAIILTGGTGGAGGSPHIDSVTWTNGLYTQGVKGYYDAMAVHPYINGTALPSGEFTRALEIRAIMDKNGESTRQLWGTEFGTPTSGTNSVSEAAQSTIATQGYARWKLMHNAGPLLWYALRDRQSYGATTDREDYFGTFHKDNSAKPVYSTLSGIFTAR